LLPASIGGEDWVGEAVLFGIVERKGDVLTRHVQMRTEQHILPQVVTFVEHR